MTTTTTSSFASSCCDPQKALLAWAKDERYLQYMQSLLRVILGCDDDDATTWYVGCMLTILALVGRHGKTRGMEACGLMYNHSNQRVVLSMMAAATMRYLLQRRSRSRTTNTATTRSNETSLTAASNNLRGEARRQFHEQQRQAMLQRAATNVSGTTPAISSSLSSPVSMRTIDEANPLMLTVWTRVRARVVDTAKSLGEALAMPQESPHALPRSSTPQPNVAIWFVRLFLAYYCYYGHYPTWMHQPIESSSHNSSEATQSKVDGHVPSNTTLTTTKPTTLRLVAWLIGMQFAATLLQQISRLTIRWLILPKWRLSPSEPSIDGGDGEDDAAALVNQAMGVVKATRRSSQPLTNAGAKVHNEESSWWCGICRMPCSTSSPLAAPINCGHVFCWDCLMQWLCPEPTSSTTSWSSPSRRSECPLCRSPCTPQQVVPLYF